MNKTAIKNFAVWARRKLIADITYKAGLIGVTEAGIAAPLPQSKPDLQFFDIGTKNYAEVSGKEVTQRGALVSAIKARERDTDYKTAFQNVVEEVAYTWFNRLIAVRFMEVNDYLPSRVRVLSSENPAKNEPDFVTTPFETDLDFTPYESDRVMQLKDENKLDELFRMLFIKQCNKLGEILPELFEKTDDYTELLCSVSFTDKDGVVYHLVHDISEDDFDVSKEGQVEILGWMYQYYNTEPKDEVFALLKKNVKITKERIPAATQLFTPDWIVRYMIENSLGRLWVEGHPNESLKANWKYYLEEAQQEPEVQTQLEAIRAEYKTIKPEEIKIIDPCMGSGHILVYAFDVLMQIYTAQGYAERDAAKSIIQNNLYGLDIDKRAYQLAYFAVMMKARQYNHRIFSEGIKPNLYAFEDSNGITSAPLHDMGLNLTSDEYSRAAKQAVQLVDEFMDAKEYGSILNISQLDWDLLRRFAMPRDEDGQLHLDIHGEQEASKRLQILINIGETMAQKYDAVCTNPPYMGASGMGAKLNEYVKKNYPDSKSDLFAVFIERCGQMTAKNCYQAMITQHAWMFLSSFEKLRAKLLTVDTVNMAHLGARAFEEIGGEVVQTTSFVMRKSHTAGYKGTYCRLIEPTTQQGKENMFLSMENRYAPAQDNFSKIPGSPIAYWVSEDILRCYENKTIYDFANPCKGIDTGDNSIFLRLWHEVSAHKMFIPNGLPAPEKDFQKKKWFPYNKGGNYRKWYGNNEYILNWENNGSTLRQFKGSNLRNKNRYFEEGITWSTVTSGTGSFRFFSYGFLFDNGGSCLFARSNLFYIQGLLNSSVSKDLLTIQPTINNQPGTIGSLPLIISSDVESIETTVKANISLSKIDWDSFEISWDFKRHPLVMLKQGAGYGTDMSKWNYTVKSAYEAWERICNDRFNQLKANEESLNRIFIDIYGLQNELTPDVEDTDVTVRKADLTRDIKSLVSYAVGCMFGRYSLDAEGLAYAGGVWDGSKYTTFIPDADNCIPITDEEYFEDDIVGRFVRFIKLVYGEETLETNLDFIADALGNKGNTSREVIRNYFLNDFIKDHIKIYQKRPIYWQFDSGKQNGFKALVYMHRWNADTVGNVRVEYLHRIQRVYEQESLRMQETIDNSTNNREVAAAEKRKEKLVKQIKETKDYDAKIAHIALSRIDIDLDDGVKVNYEKVQTGQDGKKIEILAKI